MREPSVTRRAVKRLFVITTAIVWIPLASITAFLTVILTPEESAQGALVIVGLFPLIAFAFVIWTIVAITAALTMFVTRSKGTPLA
jgi:hypothetical protein